MNTTASSPASQSGLTLADELLMSPKAMVPSLFRFRDGVTNRREHFYRPRVDRRPRRKQYLNRNEAMSQNHGRGETTNCCSAAPLAPPAVVLAAPGSHHAASGIGARGRTS